MTIETLWSIIDIVLVPILLGVFAWLWKNEHNIHKKDKQHGIELERVRTHMAREYVSKETFKEVVGRVEHTVLKQYTALREDQKAAESRLSGEIKELEQTVIQLIKDGNQKS